MEPFIALPAMPQHPDSNLPLWLDLSPDRRKQRLDALGLYLNSPEPAIICRLCRFALKPFGDRVTRHLGEKHDVPKAARRGLTAFIRSLDLPDPNKLPLRPDGSPRHPHLDVQRGAACKHCDYRTSSIDLLGRHLAKSHGRKRKTSGWLRDDVMDGTFLQSWVQNGARDFWLVESDGARVAGHFDDTLHQTSISRRSRLEELHSTERERMTNRHSAAVTDVGSADMSLTTNWMRRTGWAEMFADANRDLLVRLTELPCDTREGLCLGIYRGVKLSSHPEDERRLTHIVAAFDRVFDRCEDTVKHTDISIRCWLRGQYPDRPYKAPFELAGRRSTTHKYRRLMKRCACFCFRLWRLEAGARQSLLQRSLTEGQCQALTQVWSDEVWVTSHDALRGQRVDGSRGRTGAPKERFASGKGYGDPAGSGKDDDDSSDDDASITTVDSDELYRCDSDGEEYESEAALSRHESDCGHDPGSHCINTSSIDQRGETDRCVLPLLLRVLW